jgi:putative membrane protein
MAAVFARMRYPILLLTLFAAIFLVLGIAPLSREDWLLENMLVFATVAVLVLTGARFRFSDAAYTCLFVFLVLHEVGAHYTYSEVPYERWFSLAHGVTLSSLLGWERNAYDRFLHFAYGLLVLLPTIELMRAYAPPRGWWRFVQAPALILAGSAVYELIEFTAALVFGGDLGEAYLGTQGDTWDAQKDMLCALAGALISQIALLVGGQTSEVKPSVVRRSPCRLSVPPRPPE